MMNKSRSGLVRFWLVVGAVALLAGACGGDSDNPNPATFKINEDQGCKDAPADVPGATILGYRVEGIEDLRVCVTGEVNVSAVPSVKNQPECGSPCFTIEVENFDVSEDVKIEVTYKRDGKEQETVYDPDPQSAGAETGRICVVGVGSPDPCAERITTPKDLSATAGKTKVSLTWKAAQDTGGAPLVGYEIWRSQSETEGWALLATSGGTSYTDTGLGRGTTYYYFVVAVDGDGNRSTSSNVAAATTK